MAIASTTAADGIAGTVNIGDCSMFHILADSASSFTTDGAFVDGVGVTISAPGNWKEDIFEFVLPPNLFLGCSWTDEGILSLMALFADTWRLSGTSMSTPHVTGAMALLAQDCEGAALPFHPEAARQTIRATADRVGVAPLLTATRLDPDLSQPDCEDGECEGVLDVAAAVIVGACTTNEVPTADDQAVVVAIDGAVQITLTGSDPDGDPLTFMVVDEPLNGALAGDPPTFNYVPNPFYEGPDSFTFKASDGLSPSQLATISITVGGGGGGNAAPVLNSVGNKVVDEGNTLAFTLSATDADAGDTLTYSATGMPPGATLDPNTGAFSYTPDFDVASPANPTVFNITCMVSDGTTSDSEAITITVNDVDPNPGLPVAVGDEAMMPSGREIIIDVLANDTGAPLTIQSVDGTSVEGGTLTVNGDNTVTYRRHNRFRNGIDSFTYVNTDGTNSSSPATVTVYVGDAVPSGTGAPPTASITAPTNGSTVSGTAVPVQVTATDAEDDAAPVPLTLNVEVRIDGGTWQNAASAGGTAYELAGGWDTSVETNGAHTIEARATDNDGNISTIASVNVTVEGGIAPPATATEAIVESIVFSYKGKNLKFKVSVEDNLEDPVGGATIDGILSGPLGPVPFSAPTKANGTETFIVLSAPSGCYEVTSITITAAGLNYVPGTPPPGNGLCVP